MGVKIKYYLFLDIDGVLATVAQFYANPRRWHPKYQAYPFDKKCVVVFNDIIEQTNPTIILSSTWRQFYTIDEMNEILEWNGVNAKVEDITTTLELSDPIEFTDNEIYEKRALEILQYVDDHKIENYIIIDDFNLSSWISEDHFVRTPRENEGIKQSGVKEKILKLMI